MSALQITTGAAAALARTIFEQRAADGPEATDAARLKARDTLPDAERGEFDEAWNAEIRRHRTGDKDDDRPAIDRLTDRLKLGGEAKVTRAEIHGRGADARVVLALADGTLIDFERFADVLMPARLEAAITCATGREAAYKKADAQKAAALIFEVAEHHQGASERDEARGWGLDFLRRADEVCADLGDQRDRWGAFQLLDGLDPIARARLEGRAPGSLSTVIRDPDGTRWIVSAWFGAHVRHVAAGAVNLQRLPNLMSAVGWQRRGSRGDVKATSPTTNDTIRLRMYYVPAGWEDEAAGPGDDEVPGGPTEQVPTGPRANGGAGPQVPTGPYSPTRAHTGAGALGGDLWGPDVAGGGS